MQVAVIEAARNLLGLSGADSAEFAPDTPHPVIHLMPDQRGEVPKGGTKTGWARLGRDLNSGWYCTPTKKG